MFNGHNGLLKKENILLSNIFAPREENIQKAPTSKQIFTD